MIPTTRGDLARWAALLAHPVLVAILLFGLPWVLVVVELLVNGVVVFASPPDPGHLGELPTDRQEPPVLEVVADGFRAALPQIDSPAGMARRFYLGLYAPTLTFGLLTIAGLASLPHGALDPGLAIGIGIVAASFYLAAQAVVLLGLGALRTAIAAFRRPHVLVGLKGHVLTVGDHPLTLAADTRLALAPERGELVVHSGGASVAVRGPIRQLLWLSDVIDAIEHRGTEEDVPAALAELRST